eukprot:TRINITY_DN20253_c0_g1_i1.p1 TRINITY_DN20253_c0_g1~~TRINITY_DN20253_c0_g1_i1.p1  ORF type:complete len:190 (-),score=37.79 TRINITY_DN20253_c0_g1_i1:4-573(-)
MTELSLDFSCVETLGDECECLGEALACLKSLTEVEFKVYESQSIGNRTISALAKGLRSCGLLTNIRIIVANTDVTDVGVIAIAEVLPALTNLTEFGLALDGTSVSDEGASSIFDSLYYLGNLFRLIVSFDECQGIGDVTTKKIADFMINAEKLEYFVLRAEFTSIMEEGREILYEAKDEPPSIAFDLNL